jgi:hypothetical protein
LSLATRIRLQAERLAVRLVKRSKGIKTPHQNKITTRAPKSLAAREKKNLAREGRAPGRRVPADSVKVRLRLSVNTTNTLCGGGAPLPRNPSNAVPMIYV